MYIETSKKGDDQRKKKKELDSSCLIYDPRSVDFRDRGHSGFHGDSSQRADSNQSRVDFASFSSRHKSYKHD